MISIGDILISELTQAKTYIDRLFHALGELSEAHNHPKVRDAVSDLTNDLEVYIRENLVSESFREQGLIHRNNLKSARQNFKILTNFLETFTFMSGNKNELAIQVSGAINLIYKHALNIHELTQKFASLDVQPPRVGILKAVEKAKPLKVEKENSEPEVKQFGPFSLIEGGRIDEMDEMEDEDGEQIKAPILFQIDIDELLSYTKDTKTSLLGLETKRDEKYDIYLNQGHNLAFEKKHDQALEAFEKAMSYKKNAEILTLVAWANSLLGNIELSKSQCIEAIGLDPDYGPPYNDLGSLLLTEGQIEEAIKWFELAKNASKYNNREYPYINAGRAYMMVHKYEKAINEFQKALSLCPENEDLKNTIEKLTRTLNKDEDSFDFKVNFNKNNSDAPENNGPQLD